MHKTINYTYGNRHMLKSIMAMGMLLSKWQRKRERARAQEEEGSARGQPTRGVERERWRGRERSLMMRCTPPVETQERDEITDLQYTRERERDHWYNLCSITA